MVNGAPRIRPLEFTGKVVRHEVYQRRRALNEKLTLAEVARPTAENGLRSCTAVEQSLYCTTFDLLPESLCRRHDDGDIFSGCRRTVANMPPTRS